MNILESVPRARLSQPMWRPTMRRVCVLLAARMLLALSQFPGSEAQEKGKRGLTFEVYRDAKKEFRWRLKAANGQTIGTSGQGYVAKADCMNAIDRIKEGAATAKVEEVKEG